MMAFYYEGGNEFVENNDVKNITHLYIVFPVENVSWILMEIPYQFLSQIDLVAVWSKSTPNSMTRYSMSLTQIVFVFHAGI